MNAATVLSLALVALEHAAALSAIYQTAKDDGGRDLTDAEVAQVRAAALASINRLTAAIG